MNLKIGCMQYHLLNVIQSSRGINEREAEMQKEKCKDAKIVLINVIYTKWRVVYRMLIKPKNIRNDKIQIR
jgi:hypothetical protein